MWIVVHFLEDDSVESVPEKWYNKKIKMCAWPIAKNTIKKRIEKRDYPNKAEYKWISARMLGRKYGSLEEARAKAKRAIFLSDLSANEENINNKEPQKIDSPPTLKSNSNKRKLSPIFDEVEDMYDSDKDPEYNLPGISNDNASPQKRTLNNSSPNIINSPVGKFFVEDEFNAFHLLHNNKMISKSQPSISPTLHMKTDTIKKKLFVSQPSNSTQGSNIISTNECKTMNTSDFQNLVLSTLNKIKYELSNLYTSINTQQATINTLDTFLKNSGQTIASQISNQNDFSITFEDMFPLRTEEDIFSFEEKIKDKIFRNNAISKLSVLIGIKSVGDSTRRLMSKMFSDELLLNYSLLGFKKKLNFSQLSTYRLVIDTIRIHLRFKDKLDKEIDVPLATWLSHAKYRLKI